MALTVHTSHGDMKIELFCSKAPKCCRNFLALAASGYYNNTIFHRNIRGFILQGGDPTGTGKGGESIYGERFDNEISANLTHDKRGIVSMAHSGKPGAKNGSQFFITYTKQPHLNGVYSVFGHVIDGMSVLNAIERGKHLPNSPL